MKKVFMDCSQIIKDNRFKIDEIKHAGYLVNHFKVDMSNEQKLKRIRIPIFFIVSILPLFYFWRFSF